MIKRFLLLLAIAVLAGCGTFAKPIIKEVLVYEVEYVYISVPTHLLKANEVPRPPKRELYINSTVDEKENLLITYSQELINEVKMCNSDKSIISKTLESKEQMAKERAAINKELSK